MSALRLSEIRGQERATGLLQRALANGRLAHAYLFAGPAGTGRRTTALALARACLCASAPGEGCGRCAECHLVTALSHPDLFVEDLERARAEKPTATSISIEQIRRACSHLAMRPVRGMRKVAIVEPAERLTAEAQNALLKTLEEPRGAATLVLIAANAGALLPTIRSRCQQVRFAPLAPEVVESLLVAEGAASDEARAAATLCEGSLDRARLLASGEAAERCREIHRNLDRLAELSVPEVLDLAAELSPQRGARENQALDVAAVIDWCRRGLRAAVEASATGGATAAADAAAPQAAAGGGAADRLDAVRVAARQLERAYATSRDLERNANAHLAWDCLLLDLRASRRARA